jgi:Protein of unknown function (DUF3800)
MSVDAFVVDDSEQSRPSRSGMGPLVAAGGVLVPSEAVRGLERSLAALCDETGFPAGEEFKWSPGRNQWMYSNLKFEAREQFFLRALRLAQDAGCKAIVCVEDTERAMASRRSASHREDVVTLLLERADNLLRERNAPGVVIVDRPSGNRAAEVAYLARHLELINTGTAYTTLRQLSLVVATQSRLVRLLQLADLVVSSTLQRVAGEERFSPNVFEGIKPLLRRELGRVGGVGLKIHPDFRYANLYHWLCGDELLLRYPEGVELPIPARPYAGGPDQP